MSRYNDIYNYQSKGITFNVLFADYDEFIEKTGFTNTTMNKKLFDMLWLLSGERMLKFDIDVKCIMLIQTVWHEAEIVLLRYKELQSYTIDDLRGDSQTLEATGYKIGELEADELTEEDVNNRLNEYLNTKTKTKVSNQSKIADAIKLYLNSVASGEKMAYNYLVKQLFLPVQTEKKGYYYV